jgi:type III pantothenate kinase
VRCGNFFCFSVNTENCSSYGTFNEALILQVEDEVKLISRINPESIALRDQLPRHQSGQAHPYRRNTPAKTDRKITHFLTFSKKILRSYPFPSASITFALFLKPGMDLAIDIGNTLTKLAVFSGNEILAHEIAGNLTVKDLKQMMTGYPAIDRAIMSAVRDFNPELAEFLASKTSLMILDRESVLPFENHYETPETLGKDRIAAVAGAVSLFPDENVLVIDAGTCITYDIITADRDYLGGAISPGIAMRFKALNTFTGKLPLVKPDSSQQTELIGKSTEGSIRSGVQAAVIGEVDSTIDAYAARFSPLKTVITGGDLFYFDKYLKNNIFAAPNLVLIGLKKILDINEDS